MQEHLGNACTRAEVSVNLKRSMGIEKVEVDAAGPLIDVVRRGMTQGRTQDAVGMVAIKGARPKVDFPPHRPPGRHVAPQAERIHRRRKQAVGRRKLPERIKAHEV